MNRIIDIATYILNTYEQTTGEQIKEKKLHSLLYLTQRESLAILGTPAFNEPFEGWVSGPVSREVRSWYQTSRSSSRASEPSAELKYIINNVLAAYALLSEQKLSSMTRKETSWINSRQGLSKRESGTRYLQLEDIRHDAEKIRPYDHTWGMYHDEFEDAK